MPETAFYFDVATRAFLLGVVFGVGLASLFLVRTLTALQLGSYVMLFAYFHASEFIFVAYFNPSDVKISCRISAQLLDGEDAFSLRMRLCYVNLGSSFSIYDWPFDGISFGNPTGLA